MQRILESVTSNPRSKLPLRHIIVPEPDKSHVHVVSVSYCSMTGSTHYDYLIILPRFLTTHFAKIRFNIRLLPHNGL
jgi:hypothetical protein